MSAALTLDRAQPTRPGLAETPAGVTPPAGVDLPDDFDARRQYVIPGCTIVELERYVHPAGPANPNSRTLADVVAGLNP